MVVGYIGERMGLWEYFAPRKGKSTKSDKMQIQRDEYLARKLQREEEESERMMQQKKREEETQRKLEIEAEKKGMFAKKQNVIYYHKGSDSKHFSQIVGVHFDDGPDKPYYTIKYEKSEVFVNDNGVEQTHVQTIEKQTTSDRLIRISKDEEGREFTLSEAETNTNDGPGHAEI